MEELLVFDMCLLYQSFQALNRTLSYNVCKQNHTMEIEETQRRWHKGRYRHSISVTITSLQCARVNKLIVYITMHTQQTHAYKLSRSKVPKHSKLKITYRHTRKTSKLFYVTARASTLVPAIIFQNWGSFAKVSVESINPWLHNQENPKRYRKVAQLMAPI